VLFRSWIVVAVVVFVLVLGAAIAGCDNGAVIVGLAFWPAFAVGASLVGRSNALGRVLVAQREAAAFREQLATFHAWQTHPMGGRILEQAAQRHPALAA